MAPGFVGSKKGIVERCKRVGATFDDNCFRGSRRLKAVP